eukprot:TRINITY_DN77506_c0_g1_i1.p1 TRINITY_DN77506_c0_g1~~TRINITY_DN77506_c0_g1_i1.p1  ORF type:complete len:207 (+),score=24.35 TRINITY_DN77506_c0_g1_i1:83-622(+)
MSARKGSKGDVKGYSWKGKESRSGDSWPPACKFFLQGTCNRGADCAFAHPRASPPWSRKSSKGPPVGSSPKGYGKSRYIRGDSKGKGKGKKGGRKDHLLPRETVSDDIITGTVLEWKGKFGWIMPAEPVDHEKASRHGGKIFASQDDLVDVEALSPGDTCEFSLWEDANGLGAGDIIVH